MRRILKTQAEQPSFSRLALKVDLDEETAYTICQLISAVGEEIKGYNWDSHDRGTEQDHRRP
jgi:hypothetical protein